MRMTNPTLNPETFNRVPGPARSVEVMSMRGTVNKTVVLLLFSLGAALWTWNVYYRTGDVEAVAPWMYGGIAGGLLIAAITIFRKTWAAITGPLYAVLQGLALGGISSGLEARFEGIVIQAVLLTFSTLLALLLIYRLELIQIDDTIRVGVAAAIGAIGMLFLANMILNASGSSMPSIFDGGMIGIIVGIFIVGIAALNMLLQFDVIKRGVGSGAPKYMEWYAAFGLIVSLVWLYVGTLRLLSRLRG